MATITPSPATVPPTVGVLRRLEPILLRVVSVVALLLVWEAASAWIGRDIVPGTTVVWDRLVNVVRYEDFALHMTATSARVIFGLLGALAIATVLGIVMGLNRNIERFLDGLILFGRVMPGLAWALLALMVVGVSGNAPIVAVLLAVTPLLTLQIWEATKALDADLFRMGHVFGASRLLMFRQVVVPATLPAIVGTAKLGLALSWKVVVLAELFGVDSGVGAEINRNFGLFSLDGVLAWALAFGLFMALVEYGIIGPIYSRLTRWRSPSGRLPFLERTLRQAAWSRTVQETRVEGPIA